MKDETTNIKRHNILLLRHSVIVPIIYIGFLVFLLLLFSSKGLDEGKKGC